MATAFALAVTHPTAGNIGGGGFMIVRTPDGRATTFDYREKAPGKSTPTMYVGADGNIDRSLTARGYLAPGVPGTVRGMAMAHAKFGKLPWKQVVMPAADLAGKGWLMSGIARARTELRNRRIDEGRSRHRLPRTASPTASRGPKATASSCPTSRSRSPRSRTVPMPSTPAGSPTASPKTWRPTAD